MIPHSCRRGLKLAALFALVLLLGAFTRFAGLPVWPRNAQNRNYVANLHPTPFPLNGAFYNEATRATFDWVATGANSFVDGATNIALSSNNHADGINTWEFVPQAAGVLAVTFVRWTGSTMTDCDMQFTNTVTWATGQADPNEFLPDYDFRGVARHETGHAIGFDHEDALLDNMNSYYTVGGFVPHAVGNSVSGRVYGQLPHADDKFGVRIAYPPPVPTTSVNVMCTSWREPAGLSGVARRLTLANSTYAAGAPIRVPVTVENQSNITINGGPTGLHLGIYLSADKVINPAADRGLAGFTFASNFGPHASGYYELDTVIPADVPAGTYYIGAYVDDAHAVAETSESDNFAWYGPITVTNRPDLVITGMQLSTATPVRGSTATATLTVQNIGLAPSVASAVHLYLIPSADRAPRQNDFFVGAPGVPALQPNESLVIPYPFVVPADICGGLQFFLHGEIDYGGWNQELNENNNAFAIPFTPQWPAANGLYVGTSEDGPFAYYQPFANFTTICARAQGVSLPRNTWFFLLWTCSGTTPGIPLPPFGTLQLNYDLCTELGLTFDGTYFANSRGPVVNGPAGNLATINGGQWLFPLRGLVTHFTTIYADLASGQLVGIGGNAVRAFLY